MRTECEPNAGKRENGNGKGNGKGALDMDETTLAERLAKIVRESGRTKVAFAKSVGITRNYLHTLLSGKSANCSRTLAMLIEREYGCPSGWLLAGRVAGDHPMRDIAEKMQGLDGNALRKVSDFLDGLKGEAST
jgi:predicted transcriptional regulator